MKRIFKTVTLLVMLTIMFFNKAESQIYINANVGYGFKAASQNIDDFLDFHDETNENGIRTREIVNVSFGKGLNLDLGVGYNFTKNLAGEFEISYLFGTKSKAVHKTAIGGTTNYSIKSRMLRLIPSVVLSTGSGNIEPYAKLGIVIGIGSFKYEIEGDVMGGNVLIVEKFKGSMAFGFSSEFGIMFNVSDNFSIVGGINMINMSYSPKRSEIIESKLNGRDRLSDMTTYDIKTDYVKSIGNFTSAPSEPDRELKRKYPFSSIGFNIGIRINL